MLDLSTVSLYIILYLVFMYGNDIKIVHLMITSIFLANYTIFILIQYYKFSKRNTIIGVIKIMFGIFFIINIIRAVVYIASVSNGKYEMNIITEIIWLIDLLITEIIVVTGLLIVKDQDELQDKAMFLSLLGRDLKSPLVSINSISNLLFGKNLSPEETELVGICNRSANNGLNLLSNIIE